ncbi:Abortive bacteriophage infection, resistance [Comamonadaceae bacterium]
MTSNAVIDLFKGQLDTELMQLAINRPYLNLVSRQPDPGVAFPHWYFERIEQMTQTEASEIITDGFEDEKIDAINISEDGSTVRFFQFKNPKSKNSGIEDSAVDGILATIDIFLQPRRKKTGLEDIFNEIRSAIRTAYKIIFVSSGKGLSKPQKDRIESKLKTLNGPNRNAFSYEVIILGDLLDKIYLESIPTINSEIQWKIDTPPYQTKISEHKSLVCHVDGKSLSDTFETYGEKLLQQNIRNSEGVTAANKDIYISATSGESENFYFYNNGITILCDEWEYDQPSWILRINRPQVVNGGQTIRQIHLASKDKKLKPDVKVLLRVISIGGNKDFAGHVAVNLNNQTIVKPSFLRSNHPFFIQMQHALLPLGWYLERKPGDWENFTTVERADLISKIGEESKVIQLQSGCQAYCAVFLQDLDLAKKNPKNIFISAQSGGRFELIATSEFTAEKLAFAHSIMKAIDNLKQKIKALKNQPTRVRNINLSTLIGSASPIKWDEFVPMLPQASLFIATLVGHQIGEQQFGKIAPNAIEKYIKRALLKTYARGSDSEGSWPTLLKSQTFFEAVKKGIRVTKT